LKKSERQNSFRKLNTLYQNYKIMTEKKPTIAFFGSSLTSAYWNNTATYYRGIIKYLNRLGYKVTFYEPNAFGRQKHVDLPYPDFAKSVVYESHIHDTERVILEAQNADIVIKASGIGIHDAYLESSLLQLRKPHQLLVFWDVDAPSTLDSVLNNEKDPLRELIPQFDLILTYGGGDPVVDAYHKLGAKECIPIYNALDPETHHFVIPARNYMCNLAFLGNRLPDREERISEFFIHVAEKLPDKDFILGGSGWEKTLLPSNIRYFGHVYTNEHNIFNSSASMVLNISRQNMVNYGYSPATRIFEAAGARACIVSDFWEGIERFFIPNEEILVVHKGSDLVDLLKRTTIKHAMKIGEKAMRKVLDKHTYEKRAIQVSLIFEKQASAIINYQGQL
jgi:spore maturation protein CgeB